MTITHIERQLESGQPNERLIRDQLTELGRLLLEQLEQHQGVPYRGRQISQAFIAFGYWSQTIFAILEHFTSTSGTRL